MKLLTVLFSLLLLSKVIIARLGVDLSAYTDVNQWDCLIDNYNITYTNIRLYRNIGSIDTNAANTINELYKVSSSSSSSSLLLKNSIDGYIFPCISSSSYSLSHNITCPSGIYHHHHYYYYHYHYILYYY